jgi:hypothetical protein
VLPGFLAKEYILTPTERMQNITLYLTETDIMFVAFVVDRIGTVIKEVQNLMFQIFKRNAKNYCNKISDAEANVVASRKLKFWLRRIACAMAKTKAMCIINGTKKLIGINTKRNMEKVARMQE